MSHLDKSASNSLSSDSHPSSPETKTPRGEVFDVEIESLTSKRKWKKGFIGIGLICIPLLGYGIFTAGAIVDRTNRKPQPIGPFPSAKVEAVKAVVDVAGQVKKPGVYTLDENARIQDAIKKAGGALPDADLNALNLAAWVEDGSKIVVPAKVKAAIVPTATPIIIVQSNPAETPPPRMGVPIEETPVRYLPPPAPYIPPSDATSSSPVPSGTGQSNGDSALPREKTKSGAKSSNISTQYLLANPLDINSATAGELEGLPNIGPKTAERIVAYRTANGRFRSVEELDNVKGIGEKTLARLKPYVTAR
jgi:competence protein ComEA